MVSDPAQEPVVGLVPFAAASASFVDQAYVDFPETSAAAVPALFAAEDPGLSFAAWPVPSSAAVPEQFAEKVVAADPASLVADVLDLSVGSGLVLVLSAEVGPV